MSRTGWWTCDGRVRHTSDLDGDEGYEPLETCTTCERRLPDDSGYPICPSCVGTAKGTARAIPGGPDGLSAALRSGRAIKEG